MQTTTIKASELRIGNLRQVNGKYVNAVNGATIGHIEMGIIDFIPIPLTDEWLREFGFELLEGWDDMCFWRMIESPVFFELLVLGTGFNFDHTTDIKYVHQLQNLYFALSGEELKRVEK